MTGMLNFREFYQRKPLPISPNDLTAMQKEESRFEDCTHWLIALEGCEEKGNDLRWRVVIYTTAADGYFNQGSPFFRSQSVKTFKEAEELSKEMEAFARQDQLAIVKK
ncbi:hypothetical protein [Bacillus sp. FJAT-27251]|uniref:hypothetical protein n=1 Tax=Bacillus sp. FJAT-27251 TaxID=1684142 RepID=UPI0006A79CDA|nr:hypothetical protein [Bacillus sp. FJAT-27251]